MKSNRRPPLSESQPSGSGNPWIRRLGSARSRVRYIDAKGKPVTDVRVIARMDALRVPPAWRDVHIARSPARAIQAWGFDARGRKQYRYNERAVEQRDLRKYHRMRHLAKELPRIRKQLRQDAAVPTTRDAVAAVVVRLISETFCRVGGERYLRENGTYGITTVRKSHLAVKAGTARIDYVGKGSIPQRQIVVAPDLVALLGKVRRTPGSRLFRYKDGAEWRNLNAADVNEYVRRVLGAYSAKDFRTWGGTLRAATVLAELGPGKSPTEGKRNVALAMRLVAAELGNTPTVCRKSYVHPMVIARYVDEGEVIVVARRRIRPRQAGFHLHSEDERALIVFLDRHFPDRRTHPRP